MEPKYVFTSSASSDAAPALPEALMKATRRSAKVHSRVSCSAASRVFCDRMLVMAPETSELARCCAAPISSLDAPGVVRSSSCWRTASFPRSCADSSVSELSSTEKASLTVAAYEGATAVSTIWRYFSSETARDSHMPRSFSSWEAVNLVPDASRALLTALRSSSIFILTRVDSERPSWSPTAARSRAETAEGSLDTEARSSL
mmetsp:Transcript_20728/g.61288  ORF Transcript_20728/g.61288 Transcript_20728/m.61288 type:complete len:203 (+) Transcript_20728:2011-2619(+)